MTAARSTSASASAPTRARDPARAPGCACGCGGGWDEPAARTELGNILARVRAGVWKPPEPPRALAAAAATRRRADVPRVRVLRGCRRRSRACSATSRSTANTQSDYRWRLARAPAAVLRPPTGSTRSTAELCLAFKAHKLREASELRDGDRRPAPTSATGAGGRVGPARTVVDPQADRHARRDPRRGDRGRATSSATRPAASACSVRVPEAAAHVPRDGRAGRAARRRRRRRTRRCSTRADRAARPRHARHGRATCSRQGKRPSADRRASSASRSPPSRYHLRRLGAERRRGYVGRRGDRARSSARSGVRVSELCDMRIGHVRLHDPDGARFRIPDAKTEAGIREVQMTPDLVEAVIDHIDRLRRAGLPTGPDDYLVPNIRGGRISRQRVGEIVERGRDARERAARRAGPSAAAQHDAAHAAADLHLDRAAGQQLRRQVGDGPGRPRRLEDDDGRLRAARAARRTGSHGTSLRRASSPEATRPARRPDWATIGSRRPEIEPD